MDIPYGLQEPLAVLHMQGIETGHLLEGFLGTILVLEVHGDFIATHATTPGLTLEEVPDLLPVFAVDERIVAELIFQLPPVGAIAPMLNLTGELFGLFKADTLLKGLDIHVILDLAVEFGELFLHLLELVALIP